MMDVKYLDVNGVDSVPIRYLSKHPGSCMVIDALDTTKIAATVPVPSPHIHQFLESYGLTATEAEQFYLCLLAAIYRGNIPGVYLQKEFEVKMDAVWQPVLSIVHSVSEPIWTLYTENFSVIVVDLFDLGE